MNRIAEVTLFSGIGSTKNGYKYDEKAIERAINNLKKNTAMTNERKVLVSRIRTPDGTVLESRYTHDFVQHTDANGELYFLDGGPDYRQVVKDMHSVGMMYFYLASKISADNPEGHSKAPMETLDMVLEAINQMIADGDSGIDTDTLGKYREATEKCIGVHNNNTKE